MEQQRVQDDEHLRLLSIFHYVVAGITAFCGCIPIIHVIFGLIFTLATEQFKDNKGEPPPQWFGLIFVAVGVMMIAMFWRLRCMRGHRRPIPGNP